MAARICRRVASAILIGATMAVLAPTAWASVSPSVSLDQSAGTTAGSTANLGVDLKLRGLELTHLTTCPSTCLPGCSPTRRSTAAPASGPPT